MQGLPPRAAIAHVSWLRWPPRPPPHTAPGKAGTRGARRDTRGSVGVGFERQAVARSKAPPPPVRPPRQPSPGPFQTLPLLDAQAHLVGAEPAPLEGGIVLPDVQRGARLGREPCACHQFAQLAAALGHLDSQRGGARFGTSGNCWAGGSCPYCSAAFCTPNGTAIRIKKHLLWPLPAPAQPSPMRAPAGTPPPPPACTERCMHASHLCFARALAVPGQRHHGAGRLLVNFDAGVHCRRVCLGDGGWGVGWGVGGGSAPGMAGG